MDSNRFKGFPKVIQSLWRLIDYIKRYDYSYLSLHIISAFYLSSIFCLIRSFLNPHYHIQLFYKFWSDCFTEKSDPGTELRWRATSLYQQPWSLIFYAVGFFYSCKSQHHRRSDSQTAVKEPLCCNDHKSQLDSNPSEITFQTETLYCWGIEKPHQKHINIKREGIF